MLTITGPGTPCGVLHPKAARTRTESGAGMPRLVLLGDSHGVFPPDTALRPQAAAWRDALAYGQPVLAAQ